jgi:hypothetical protein
MKTTISKVIEKKNTEIKIMYAGLFFIATLFLPTSILAQEKEQDSVKIMTQEIIDEYRALKKADRAAKVTAVTDKDGTGNDPRAFGTKWSPFYKSQELENGFTQQDVTMSGVYAVTPNFGVFYEMPLAQYRDFSDVEGYPEDAPNDVVGVGDLSMKFIANIKPLDFSYGKGSETNKKTGGIILGVDLILPTATHPLLAGNSFKMSPIVGLVVDTPMHGFFAMLNLYYFDVYKTDAAPKTSMYVGRWFYMQPLTPPGKWWGMIYLMPEYQPIYNFETKDFSSWLGVELGKIISEGNVAYIKPGWGLGNDQQTDRKVTLEIGYRYFF